ncbi:sulfatase [Microbacterium sp. HM58-2]|nr:sulfatase [Microbacterium sp. HM58-2]
MGVGADWDQSPTPFPPREQKKNALPPHGGAAARACDQLGTELVHAYAEKVYRGTLQPVAARLPPRSAQAEPVQFGVVEHP